MSFHGNEAPESFAVAKFTRPRLDTNFMGSSRASEV